MTQILSSLLLDRAPSSHDALALQESYDYFHFQKNLLCLLTIKDTQEVRDNIQHFMAQYKEKIQHDWHESFYHFLNHNFTYTPVSKKGEKGEKTALEHQGNPVVQPSTLLFCFDLLEDLINGAEPFEVKDNLLKSVVDFILDGIETYVYNFERDHFYFLEKPLTPYEPIKAENLYLSLYRFSKLLKNQNHQLNPLCLEVLEKCMARLINRNWVESNSYQAETIFECVGFFKSNFYSTQKNLAQFEHYLSKQIKPNHPYYFYKEKVALSQTLDHPPLSTPKTLKI